MYKIGYCEEKKVLKYLKESLEEEYGKKIKYFKLKSISIIQDGSVDVTVYFTFSNKEKYENSYTIHWEKYYDIVCRN